MRKNISLKQLLWVDGIAALLAGVSVLAFSSALSVLFDLPENVLRTQAIITLVYASYSISLANKKSHPKHLIYGLAIANWVYALVVTGLMIYFFRTVTIYGTLYFIAEVLFIGTLAFFEWNTIKRKSLQVDNSSDI